MTTPIIFFLFFNSFGTVLLNDNFLTTLIFNEKIRTIHTGASKSELYFKIDTKRKILFLKGMGKKINTNISVLTVSGKLYSFLLRNSLKPHSIITIKDGKESGHYIQIKDYNGLKISESDYITKIENQSQSTVVINNIEIKARYSYQFPKGSPLFLGQKRIYR